MRPHDPGAFSWYELNSSGLAMFTSCPMPFWCPWYGLPYDVPYDAPHDIPALGLPHAAPFPRPPLMGLPRLPVGVTSLLKCELADSPRTWPDIEGEPMPFIGDLRRSNPLPLPCSIIGEDGPGVPCTLVFQIELVFHCPSGREGRRAAWRCDDEDPVLFMGAASMAAPGAGDKGL